MQKDTSTHFESSELPRHVAVIMDGNNRWARVNGLSGSAGHRAGAEAARQVVYSCVKRDIKYLTLFAFSSENWLRPNKEVKGLMALFLAVLKRNEINQLHLNNVRLQFIGNRGSFSAKLQHHMRDVEELTAANTGTVVTVAADYGGRWDIANAARQIAEQVKQGKLRAEDVSVATMEKYICLADTPMPDLCIRTGGENRISNFLLWQFAYTELYFTDCYWPDFDDTHFQQAMDDYGKRQRRYGHLNIPSHSDELPVTGSMHSA
ncbi:MAG: polyprenyl diphosphate synthase [Gammaproteobacteria bacterium]|nr:polyprenyl diphosphate synthase [Gammaproteobacteria bacterium]MDP2140953.1 polyprenyl diphosphate synthase [Gammaproteobacteria bacterium]MDP2349303.1 polyprenyl diphosphate synthase [Gammaproteobacteria bacterium]